MRDARDNNDASANAPLDFRFVILGVAMLVLSAVIMVFNEDIWLRHVGITGFVLSFFVMSKRKLRK